MIPSVAHFVWLGPDLPWLHTLALRSASRAGRFAKVVLHSDHDLSGSPYWRSVERLPGFETRPCDVRVLATAAGVDPARVTTLYGHMTSPAARSDILRTLVLAAEGGVYFDTDTVTVRDFTPLRERGGFFCGEERICFPEWSTSSLTFRKIVRAYGLAGLRLALRMLPSGWRHFQRMEGIYDQAVNNAVLGSEPRHPFVRQFLDAMLDLPVPQARKRYALGPHLLATTVRAHGGPGVQVLPPAFFYPLGPVIAQHWWRRRQHMPAWSEVISEQTLTVHWYASTRSWNQTLRVTPAYVRRHAPHQLFSALALPYADG